MREIVVEAVHHNWAFWVCLLVSVFLLVTSFFIPPKAVIDGSILAAVGELFGFAALANISAAESAATVDFASGQTAVGKVDAMVAALPVAMIKKGVNIFMSYGDFMSYIQELNGSCCSNRAIQDASAEEFTYLGNSKVKLIPVLGLENAGGVMVAATPDALVYGTDIEGSETTFEVWYSKDDKKFKFQLLFNAGVAIKWPDEVIVGSAA